jgi:hypothetical protein
MNFLVRLITFVLEHGEAIISVIMTNSIAITLLIKKHKSIVRTITNKTILQGPSPANHPQISTAGFGINNPMNIKSDVKNNWVGKIIVGESKFEQFSDMWLGYRAGIIVLSRMASKRLRDAIAIYAPASDGNAPDRYYRTLIEIAPSLSTNNTLQYILMSPVLLTDLLNAMTIIEQGPAFIVDHKAISDAVNNYSYSINSHES